MITHSSFIKSIQNINDAPANIYPEIALLGRSNVGKSSLINILLNKKLAKSSNTPGKTKLINFFTTKWKLEDGVYNLTIIDLPGFGYAKVSKETKRLWDKDLSEFLRYRQSIKLFCHLIDSRHQNLEIDKDIYSFLKSCLVMNNGKMRDCKILNIYTKSDKLKQNEIQRLKNSDKVYFSILKVDNLCKINMLDSISRSVFDREMYKKNMPEGSLANHSHIHSKDFIGLGAQSEIFKNETKHNALNSKDSKNIYKITGKNAKK